MPLDTKTLCKLTKKLSNEQLKQFTKEIRDSLLSAGIDQKLVDTSLKKAIKTVQESSSLESDCEVLLEKLKTNASHKDNRGIDSIGRVLVEYCFSRTPETKMIWPENSDQDIKAREVFVEGVIPRPLMRYFLVSVRGTIPQLNKYKASSVLFGKENEAHEQRKEFVDALVAEFRTNSCSDHSQTWTAIYDDERFQRIALELIGEIRRKIEQFGLERYVRILENLHQRDPEKTSVNAMERPFNLADAKQIEEALWAAERNLARG